MAFTTACPVGVISALNSGLVIWLVWPFGKESSFNPCSLIKRRYACSYANISGLKNKHSACFATVIRINLLLAVSLHNVPN